MADLDKIQILGHNPFPVGARVKMDAAFRNCLMNAGFDPSGHSIAHQRRIDHADDPLVRADADDAFFMQRELLAMMKTTFDVEYPDLVMRKLLPISTEIPAGAQFWSWKAYNRVAQAKVVAQFSDDIPRAEVFGQEYISRIYSTVLGYEWSIMDLRFSAMAGIPIDTRRAIACREGQEELLERIAFFGQNGLEGAAPTVSSDPYQIYGFSNFPTVGLYQTSVNWTSSVANFIADFPVFSSKVFQNSLGKYRPDTLCVGTAMYDYLATTPRSPTFTSDTLLQFIMENSPWIKEVVHCPLLDTAGFLQNGTTPGPRMVLFKKSDMTARLIVPQEFEQLPPQWRNLSALTPTHMRVGGVMIFRPLAFYYCDGANG